VTQKDLGDTAAPFALDIALLGPLIEERSNEGGGQAQAQFDAAFEARVQSEAAARAKVIEQQIRLIVDERVRNVPIRNRVRLLYKSKDAMAAIGCGHSKFASSRS
jgi:hypothetical protein